MGEVVLVTGANGFIGQRVVKYLVEAGHKVRALVLPDEASSSSFSSSVEIATGDISNLQKVYESTRGCSTIIHLAALVSDGGTELDHQRITVGGTRNIFLSARQGTRVVLASSITYYGNALGTEVCAETINPGIAQGPYSRAKQAQEDLARLFEAKGGDVVIIRPANVYGAGSGPWVKDVVEQISSGLPCLIDQGSGNAGLVYVNHVAQAMVNAMEKKIKGGSVFNICDELEVTWKQYFDDIAEIIREKKPMSIPRPLAQLIASLAEPTWSFLSLPNRPPLSKEALNLVGNDLKIPAKESRQALNLETQKSYNEVLIEIRKSLQ